MIVYNFVHEKMTITQMFSSFSLWILDQYLEGMQLPSRDELLLQIIIIIEEFFRSNFIFPSFHHRLLSVYLSFYQISRQIETTLLEVRNLTACLAMCRCETPETSVILAYCNIIIKFGAKTGRTNDKTCRKTKRKMELCGNSIRSSLCGTWRLGRRQSGCAFVKKCFKNRSDVKQT